MEPTVEKAHDTQVRLREVAVQIGALDFRGAPVVRRCGSRPFRDSARTRRANPVSRRCELTVP
jgi:hypothetical protein